MKNYRMYVWNQAITYLAQKVDIQLVREYMSTPDFRNPTTMAEVYHALISSLRNRQGMPNAIGDISRLATILCKFDHLAVLQRFGSGWEALFDAFQQSVKPTSRMEKTNKHNYWVIFCRGCLSAARYLRRFDNTEEFLKYVSQFDASSHTRPALPLLLATEVFGIGFPLACDFLKEIGFVNYSRPDTHLTDIFHGLGLSDNTPLGVFEAIAMMASDVGETPYAVDKLFWLIGSGRLYNHDMTFHTDKFEFVKATVDNWERLDAEKL